MWVADRREWGMGGGTGVCIGRDDTVCYALTNKHVIEQKPGEPSTEIYVCFKGMEKVRATFVAVSKECDLGLVAFFGSAATPTVPLAEGAAIGDEEVSQVGYPMGQGPVQRRFRVAGYRRSIPVTLVLRVGIISGDSGSGIFNARSELVGVAYGRHAYDQRESYAVPLAETRQFVKTCLPHLFGGGRKPESPYASPYPAPPSQPAPPHPGHGLGGKLAELEALKNQATAAFAAQQREIGELRSSMSEMRMLLETIRKDMATLGKGCQGPPGPAGPQGPPGPAGSPGKDGQTGPEFAAMRAEIVALRKQLEAFKTTPLYAEILDSEGNLRQRVEFGPGQPLRLRLIPVPPKKE